MFRPQFEGEAVRSMHGMPKEALDILVSVMVAVCEDPYDRFHSAPLQDSHPDICDLQSSGTSASSSSG